VSQAWYIAPDVTPGRDIDIRGLWDEEALNFIRKQIMKRVKAL